MMGILGFEMGQRFMGISTIGDLRCGFSKASSVGELKGFTNCEINYPGGTSYKSASWDGRIRHKNTQWHVDAAPIQNGV